MEHVVFFPAHDGTPAFRRVATLEDAVRLVEHLRNVEGVAEVSCHALTEVPLAFKAYYRVEVPAGEVAPSAPAVEPPAPVLEVVPDLVEAPREVAVEVAVELAAEAPASASAEEPVAVTVVPDQPVAALAASNGSAPESRGPSSLGFFSR